VWDVRNDCWGYLTRDCVRDLIVVPVAYSQTRVRVLGGLGWLGVTTCGYMLRRNAESCLTRRD
jgi:hypothetical protein